MKVLIAAYACEPGKGSEPGIGWDWAMALAARPDLDITVLTRTNNRGAIEAALQSIGDRPVPRFVYFDLPGWVQALKRKTGSIYLYYLLWCRGVRRLAATLVQQDGFDVFHHLTFSTDWVPGCIPGRMECATVIGPLGGYDTSPAILGLIPARYGFTDRTRKLIRRIGLYLRATEFRRCDLLIANNDSFAETYRRLAPYSPIAVVSTQLGAVAANNAPSPAPATDGRTRILMAGRMLYWKGLDLAIDALASLRQRGLDFEAVMVGSGPDAYVRHLKSKSDRLCLGDRLSFVEQMPRDEFLRLMAGTDVFLYPSFYGTADSIMIESLEKGVPIVCLPSAGAHELLGTDYPYLARDFSADALAESVLRVDGASDEYRSVRNRLLASNAPDRKLQLIEAAYRDACRRTASRDDVVLQNA